MMWRLKDIEAHLKDISKQGFTHILTSPLEPTKEDIRGNFWVLYQPIEWKLGNELGTKQDLKHLVEEAKKYDIEIMVDVIISHIGNEGGGVLELEPHHLCPYPRNLFRVKNNVYDWDSRFEMNFYNNHLPFLDHYKKDVATLANSYIDELEKCGIKYIRLDSGRHIPLPEEGCSFLDKVFKNRNIHVMSEVIFDTKEITQKYTRYGSSFTNMYNFEVPSLVSSPFSHDDALTFGGTITDNEILRRYEDILNRGRHILYYARPYETLWKSIEIKEINNRY